MLPVPTATDLRVPLARALVCRLAELDCTPSTSVGVCKWLARLPDAIERIDAGEFIVMVTPVAFIAQLFTPAAAVAAGAQHPDVQFYAVDLRPALAAIRSLIAERN